MRSRLFDLNVEKILEAWDEINLSLLKSGKVRGVRFSTLDAICRCPECAPSDILEYQPDAPSAQEAITQQRRVVRSRVSSS